MSDIIPAILVSTSDELTEKVRMIEPYTERAHLDIADGIFVPNMTISFEDVESIETTLRFSVHLMVSKPENHIVRWVEILPNAESFIFHAEATSQPQAVIDAVKEHDGLIGVALNPETPISAIEEYVDIVDIVQFLTVTPGFYGSPFQESVIAKIKDFQYYYPDKTIVVDGGITPETVSKFEGIAVSDFVSGSYIFKHSAGVQKAIESLKSAIN